MATRRLYAYSLTFAQVGPVHDPAFAHAPESVLNEVRKWIIEIGLQEKDRDLAAGLDRKGNPLRPIAPETRAHRKSAMGPADPSAPPLTPAHALSRTRSLLEGESIPDGARFYWDYDEHTGGSCGRILHYHRLGIGRFHRIKRDVIGLGPAAIARVRKRVLAKWAEWKRQERTGHPPKVEYLGRKKPNPRAKTIQVFTKGAPPKPKPAPVAKPKPAPKPSPVPPVVPPPPPPKPVVLPPSPAPPKPKPVPPPVVVPVPAPAPAPKPVPTGPILPGRPIQERIAAYEDGERIRQVVLGAYARTEPSVAEQRKSLESLKRSLKTATQKYDSVVNNPRSGLKEIGDADARVKDLEGRIRFLTDEIERRRQQAARALIREALEVDEPLKILPIDASASVATVDPLNDMTRGAWDFGYKFVQSITAKSASGSGVIGMGVGQIPASKEQRAFFDIKANVLNLKIGEGIKTAVHELGHALDEHLNLGVRAKEFLRYRTAGEPPVRLMDVFPGAGYRPYEEGRSDRFADVFGDKALYVGKEYEGHVSEITAMGLQMLYEDPVKFAENDPEYFKFIVGLLRGALR